MGPNTAMVMMNIKSTMNMMNMTRNMPTDTALTVISHVGGEPSLVLFLGIFRRSGEWENCPPPHPGGSPLKP